MTLDRLGSVGSEGGPLLLADAAAVRTWSGAEGPDYRLACAPFDRDSALEGIELLLGGHRGVLWEMAGAGVADVYRVLGGGFMLVRYWLMDPHSSAERLSLASQAVGRQTPLGRLTLSTGFACVMWAAITGEEVEPGPGSAAVEGVQNSEGTSLVFAAAPGEYECLHDSVSTEQGGRARRCHFMPLASR